MSLINDALLKAERDRADAIIAEASHLPPLARAEKLREQKRRRSLTPVIVNAALLAGIFAVLIVIVLRPRTSNPAAADAPVPIATATQPAAVGAPDFSDPAAPTESPFTSVSEDLPPSATQSAEYALAGMSMLGADTLISVLRRSDQRSVWIPVGKSVNGISAVSYDAEKDLAVIRVGDETLTIRMNANESATQPAE